MSIGLPKESVTSIRMLNKNMIAMIHSSDSNPDFFDIVAWVLQGDILAPYMFII